MQYLLFRTASYAKARQGLGMRLGAGVIAQAGMGHVHVPVSIPFLVVSSQWTPEGVFHLGSSSSSSCSNTPPLGHSNKPVVWSRRRASVGRERRGLLGW